MLSQMSADMWQVPEPDEEAVVAAARLRAKEEHERVQAEQARLEEEAAQAVRDAEAARQRSEAAKAAAEAAREVAERLAAQMQTDATQLTAMLRLEQQKAATRKDAEMSAEEQRKADEAERLRAKAQEEVAAKGLLDNLEDELHSVEDRQLHSGGGDWGWVGCGVGWVDPTSRERMYSGVGWIGCGVVVSGVGWGRDEKGAG